MATNEILQFSGTDTGTNLLTQAEYVADSHRPIGNQPGIARAKLVNKALKQSSIIAAAVSQYIADRQANNIVDTITPSAIAGYLSAAVQADVGTIAAGAVQNNTYIAATASGTNSYTITPSPAISAYAAGQEFLVTFTNGNTTAATLQVSGLASPPSIVKQNSAGAYVALVNGDIPASHRSRMRMLSTTQVQLVDQKPSTVSAASTSAAGIVELADSTEAADGTDATRALTPSTLRSGVNATGSAPIYAPRAWVNFNGTGTVAIRASGNVSSITDNGTGDYTVNFTTAMPDANYGANVTACGSDAVAGGNSCTPAVFAIKGSSGATYQAPTTTAFRVILYSTRNNTYYDEEAVIVTVLK